MNNSRESRKSQVINPEDILKFVGQCASKLLLLKGIVTPPEAIKAIAVELPKLNPSIMKNKNAILLTIALGDFQFRTPKQMTIDDFNITPEKINAIKNFGMKVYTEEEVSRIKKNITNSKIQELENVIENLNEKLRVLEYNWKNFPEPLTKKGYEEIMNLQKELMDKDIKQSEQIDIKDRIIRMLEEKLERHNLLKNGTDGIAEPSEITTQETVTA